VVSAHTSPRDRNPALRSVIVARLFRRSRVDRARRSSLVIISTSPASSWSSALRSWLRSVLGFYASNPRWCQSSSGFAAAHEGGLAVL
jgi:hypothetical protein